MAGEHDFIRESHIRMIAASIPGAKLAIIQGGGHFHLKSRHRESNRILSDFFLGLAAL